MADSHTLQIKDKSLHQGVGVKYRHRLLSGRDTNELQVCVNGGQEESKAELREDLIEFSHLLKASRAV